MSDVNWEEITKGRMRGGSGLAHILKIPMRRSGREVAAGLVKDGDRVLDAGANDRNLGTFFKERGLKLEYLSYDVDRSLKHDFYSLSEITGRFDAVFAMEIIEHMGVASITELFVKAREALKDGGAFVVSTPNVCHPVVFWRDCTHTTPVRYDELYGLLKTAGFDDVTIYRIGDFKMKYRVLAFLLSPVLKLFRIDYAPGILAVARAGKNKR